MAPTGLKASNTLGAGGVPQHLICLLHLQIAKGERFGLNCTKILLTLGTQQQLANVLKIMHTK